MKRIKYIICTGLLLSSLFLVSCEETLSSKGEFEEKPILYSVLNADTTFQTVYLYKNYSVEERNSNSNPSGAFISGADVKIIVNGTKEYHLQEGEAERTDTSVIKGPVKFYYLNNYKPVSRDVVEVIALLDNGTELKATTKIPVKENLMFIYEKFNSAFDPTFSSNYKVSWDYREMPEDETPSFYLHLYLVYSKTDNPGVKMYYEVPYQYLKQGEEEIPLFHGINDDENQVYSGESIVRSINLISNGDSNRQNYIFHPSELRITMMERNLAAYISRYLNYLKEVNVRLGFKLFSNVENGIGFIGAMSEKKGKLLINADYMRRQGYKTSY